MSAVRERLVVIGNGMAGCRTVEEVLKRDPGRYEIAIFGAEPRVNYNRILLSPVLAGEKAFADIVINDQAWYDDNAITLHSGRKVTAIDAPRRTVVAEGGLEVGYDRLVLATGSDPVRLPLPGVELTGVVTFRDLDDVEAMIAACANPGARAVVIGGGLLGLEAAYGLARRGMAATVVHLMDVLMERQLDASAGHLLTEALRERGVETVLGAQSEAIVGEGGRVSGPKLKDGRVLPCELLVMAVGIRPNGALEGRRSAGQPRRGGGRRHAHLRPRRLCGGRMRRASGQVYGLVAPIWEMCRALAEALTDGEGGYAGSVLSTRLKVSGVDVFSAGKFSGGEGCEDIVFRDAGRGVYKRLVIEDGRLAAAVLFGDAADGGGYFDLMRRGENLGLIRSWTPAKVKLAVSGCPRNCAEATCKDIGVICVDSGYEIHVGGAAGLHIRGTELLTKVADEEQARQLICAIVQYYREDAWYLERIYKWMARIGLETIRAAMEDGERRAGFYARFRHAQSFSQDDPWAERVAGKDAAEFAPLSTLAFGIAAE